MHTVVSSGKDYLAGSGFTQIQPSLVLVFGQPATIADGSLFSRIQNMHPHAIVCGCSTGGQINGDRLVDDDAVVLSLAFESTEVRLAEETDVELNMSRQCGTALGRVLHRDDLAGVFLLADGLRTNGNELALGLSEAVGESVTVAGGLAADGDAFTTTLVSAGGVPATGRAIALGFYGANFRMQTGIGDGWQVFGPRRRVTRAAGNKIYALDGEPILDLYRRYLDDEDFAGLPRTGLLFPLQISLPSESEQAVIRAVLGVDHVDRALIFGGDVPVGSIAQMMRGTHERLVEGAATAASQIESALSSNMAAILVSCIGRRLLMGSRVEDEIVSVTDKLGAMPRVGFYSLGEISPFPGTGRPRLHNETMTIITLSEEG